MFKAATALGGGAVAVSAARRRRKMQCGRRVRGITARVGGTATAGQPLYSPFKCVPATKEYEHVRYHKIPTGEVAYYMPAQLLQSTVL